MAIPARKAADRTARLVPSRDPDVIVVGAGATGLAATSMLAEAGYDVLVLEAPERIGGRVLTERLSGLEVPIEPGAEFIHWPR